MIKVEGKTKKSILDIGELTKDQGMLIAEQALKMLLDVGMIADNAVVDDPLLLLSMSDYAKSVIHDNNSCSVVPLEI